ncbi:control protein C.BclI (plasmid) [[Bacillus] caldolyticus]|uniref:C.BclI n=1 Tax=Bacillus caldolyticus TaxID=1394 RepID=E5LGB7_BACCL|nr:MULTISPECIES: helix-turn-helix transcriptional regulator [Geobacillus thermoleovorans group]2B5A_A Chain A, C.BclI [[Bacillus] caldolyticus]2B5A_B Chain B, C.BclI [[Bacillus] caldolyticus]2B5A_C Chain C, C.BclI [[Bacillus] caldolyticus]2B5A_D Chain D, C.BclI [[Bacillus] caldolyticus]ADQ20505.1 C.BclI [[Bacillus] caldolyticus]AUI38376.1 control protein C.BclI [[Bacillus] caldolyticus]MED3668986.1 helix-turn-helix transcriptional regulator [Geobacillus kaustophilus]
MINEIEIKRKFGRTLKKIRTQKGVSQEELADLAGLHRTYISEVERGDRNISLINIHKICAALDIPASTFFRKMEEEN